MKKLLAVGVYSDCERNAEWLSLQRRFLAETTCYDYDFEAYLSGGNPAIFRDAGVPLLGQAGCHPLGLLTGRVKALNNIICWLQMRDEYEYLLVLDSDAFPFQHNWLERLVTSMRADESLPERHFASVCQAENLDTFPKPTVFFAAAEYLRRTSGFFTVQKRVNLAGLEFHDAYFERPGEVDERRGWLPLVRTNTWNPHPLLAGVYGGLFYHHGAGSRPLQYRAVDLGVYDNSFPRYQHGHVEGRLFQEVSKNPKLFLQQLVGRPVG